MITYKWSIEKLKVSDNKLVVGVYWRVTATQDDLTAAATGIRNLTRSDSFIAYEELTEQQVLNWCFEPELNTWTDADNNEHSVTRLVKDEGEAQVTGQIERQLAQKVTEPALPWL